MRRHLVFSVSVHLATESHVSHENVILLLHSTVKMVAVTVEMSWSSMIRAGDAALVSSGVDVIHRR